MTDQKTLGAYEVVEEAIDRNKQPRIRWKRWLDDHESLNNNVAGYYKTGFLWEETLDILAKEVAVNGFDLQAGDNYRRLKISVASLYSRIQSCEKSAYKRRQ